MCHMTYDHQRAPSLFIIIVTKKIVTDTNTLVQYCCTRKYSDIVLQCYFEYLRCTGACPAAGSRTAGDRVGRSTPGLCCVDPPAGRFSHVLLRQNTDMMTSPFYYGPTELFWVFVTVGLGPRYQWVVSPSSPLTKP